MRCSNCCNALTVYNMLTDGRYCTYDSGFASKHAIVLELWTWIKTLHEKSHGSNWFSRGREWTCFFITQGLWFTNGCETTHRRPGSEPVIPWVIYRMTYWINLVISNWSKELRIRRMKLQRMSRNCWDCWNRLEGTVFAWENHPLLICFLSICMNIQDCKVAQKNPMAYALNQTRQAKQLTMRMVDRRNAYSR